MNKIIGEPVGRRHMQPPQFLIDPQPGFVKVDHFRRLNRLLKPFINRCYQLTALRPGVVQGAF